LESNTCCFLNADENEISLSSLIEESKAVAYRKILYSETTGVSFFTDYV